MVSTHVFSEGQWGKLVILISDTFDQPLRELLLRDWLALVSSAIGDEELSFVLAPDAISMSQMLGQSSPGTGFVHHISIGNHM